MPSNALIGSTEEGTRHPQEADGQQSEGTSPNCARLDVGLMEGPE
jgi:hypothetical protein